MQQSNTTKIVQSNINAVRNTPIKREDVSYVKVDYRVFNVGEKINFNLYYEDIPTHMTLFLQSNTALSKNDKLNLEKIEHIYTTNKEKSAYDAFIENRLQNIVHNNNLSLDEKTVAIYTSSAELVDSLFRNPEALENAQHTQNIVSPILESIIHNHNTIASFIKIIEYDYYTHTHSLNVSIYSLSLGAKLGMKQEELRKLGISALLHDLGKSKIDSAIVNKNGTLTEEEFLRMKQHPNYGFDIATTIGIKNRQILEGIKHHHEKLCGGGYPDGLKGSEITLFPRIIGICDVFDALSTKRSYKDAMSSFEAFSLMKNHMSTHLDMKILTEFIKMLRKN